MKIGFYLDNSKKSKIDYSIPESGNPGMGGTQFMIWTVSYYFAKLYPNIKVILFAPNVEKLPTITSNILTKDIYEAIDNIEKYDIDYFICRSTNDKKFYSRIENSKNKIILWGHNYATYSELTKIHKCKSVVQYICVSKEQLESIQVHPISKKATYIFNSITTNIYPNSLEVNKEIDLCYVGSIIPTKGFDWVAKLFKALKDEGIKVKLSVIGSGQLYNSNQVLGKYNIADPKFEKSFIKYIIDENHEIDKNIVFYGVLDHEKKVEVMSNAKYGIVNPSGETETFGISAIEFEAMGIPVITANKGGLKDTVPIEYGYLANTFEELVKITKEALYIYDNEKEKYINQSISAKKYVEENFDILIIIDKWKNLIESIDKNKDIYHGTPKKFFHSMKDYIKLLFYKQ